MSKQSAASKAVHDKQFNCTNCGTQLYWGDTSCGKCKYNITYTNGSVNVVTAISLGLIISGILFLVLELPLMMAGLRDAFSLLIRLVIVIYVFFKIFFYARKPSAKIVPITRCIY